MSVPIELAQERSADRRRAATRATLIAVAVLYVAALVLAPLGGIIWSTAKGGWHVVSDTLTRPDVLHAYLLTGIITLITVVVTAVLGVIVAIVVARHSFPGRRLVSALVDLPLAVSPVIVGLMAILLFGRGGWFEPFFASRGIQIIFALPSMVIVTIFICIPFTIREIVPLLQELGTEEEDAARTLGASSMQTFLRVTVPNIRWGLLYGIALSTARALGEIGAVLIVSGTLQGQTETATLYVLRALEERQDAAGNLVALSLALASVVLLAAIELFKRKRMKEIST